MAFRSLCLRNRKEFSVFTLIYKQNQINQNMRDFKDIKVAVAGTGYVGLSIATLLAQHHHVTAVDVIPEKVEKLNNKISPIQDDYIEKYLAEKPLNLVATLDGKSAYADADFVVIAAPTNYDPVKNYFDTTHVEEVIDLVLEVNPDAIMVIKSTIPVGYTRNLYLKYAQKGVKKFNLLFSPEFLRESKALYDNLYPSRIIVGYPKIIDKPEFEAENNAIESVTDVEMLKEAAKTFAALLQTRVRSGKQSHRISNRRRNAERSSQDIRCTLTGRSHQGKHRHLIYGHEGSRSR
ncbi:uDP-glucose 6-dehydrogenase [Bacteroides sp. CAG:530]|nr:uDP-glucose 6-dehydrogenase [Bacteroides sp. CAG:530]